VPDNDDSEVAGCQGKIKMTTESSVEMEQDLWNELYEMDSEHFGTTKSDFAVKCSKVIKALGLNRILDIGCGYGRDSIFFGKEGFRVVAMDYSQKALAILQERLSIASARKNIEAIQHDIRKGIPFDACRFDAVYSCLLFPVGFTGPQIEYAFSEIHRVLRVGGLFLACVRVDVSGFFNERYFRSRLNTFNMESLVAEDISVGSYNFNVINFIARKGGRDGDN
jgi:SAM-dependent methyltransferase